MERHKLSNGKSPQTLCVEGQISVIGFWSGCNNPPPWWRGRTRVAAPPVALFSNLASGLVRSWLENWRSSSSLQQKKVHFLSYKRQTPARSVNRLKLKTRCFAPHSYLLSLQSQPNTPTASESGASPSQSRTPSTLTLSPSHRLEKVKEKVKEKVNSITTWHAKKKKQWALTIMERVENKLYWDWSIWQDHEKFVVTFKAVLHPEEWSHEDSPGGRDIITF